MGEGNVSQEDFNRLMKVVENLATTVQNIQKQITLMAYSSMPIGIDNVQIKLPNRNFQEESFPIHVKDSFQPVLQ